MSSLKESAIVSSNPKSIFGKSPVRLTVFPLFLADDFELFGFLEELGVDSLGGVFAHESLTGDLSSCSSRLGDEPVAGVLLLNERSRLMRGVPSRCLERVFLKVSFRRDWALFDFLLLDAGVRLDLLLADSLFLDAEPFSEADSSLAS